VIDVSEKHIAFIFRAKQSTLLELSEDEDEDKELLQIADNFLSWPTHSTEDLSLSVSNFFFGIFKSCF
jgi:hypothetical protein